MEEFPEGHDEIEKLISEDPVMIPWKCGRRTFRKLTMVKVGNKVLKTRSRPKALAKPGRAPASFNNIIHEQEKLKAAGAVQGIMQCHRSHSVSLMRDNDLRNSLEFLKGLVRTEPPSQLESSLEIQLNHESEMRRRKKKRRFQSTADCQNRWRDKKRVETTLNLPEQGIADVEFWSPDGKLLIATGYNRMVYGDHGPYIEFWSENVVWASFESCKRKGEIAYYDEYYTKSKDVKLLLQKLSVHNMPNPPPGKYAANHNRKEGYADYKPNMSYVSPDEVTVEGDTYLSILRGGAKQKERKWKIMPRPMLREKAQEIYRIQKRNDDSYLSGLRYYQDFITEEEQRQLLDIIWGMRYLCDDYQQGRASGQFGWRLDYEEGAVNLWSIQEGPKKEIPKELGWLVERIKAQVDKDIFAGESVDFNQLIINIYGPSQPIMPHIDRTSCFGPVVCGISLFSSLVFEFTPKNDATPETKRPIMLFDRSFYIMSGSSRYDYFHSISAERDQRFYDTKIRRSFRTSLTFRHAFAETSEPLARSTRNPKSENAWRRE